MKLPLYFNCDAKFISYIDPWLTYWLNHQLPTVWFSHWFVYPVTYRYNYCATS